jgi:hypothetical protein
MLAVGVLGNPLLGTLQDHYLDRKRHTEYSNAGNGKEKGLMDAISGMGIG